MKKIRDRITGEVMLEEIFFSTTGRNFYLFDYVDLRNIRRDNTLKVVYAERFNIDNQEGFELWKNKVADILAGESCSKCIVQLSESVKKTGLNVPFSEDIQDVMFATGCNWHFFRYMSNKLKGSDISINLYVFSKKIEEDRDMDRKIEEVLGICKDIHSASVGSFELPVCNADERLNSYSKLLLHFLVNNDSAEYIKELVEDALYLADNDLKNGLKIEISTLQNFIFVVGNLWMNLAPFFPVQELRKVPRKWGKMWRKLRESSPGYIKEASDFAQKVSKISLKRCSDECFEDLMEQCRYWASQGNLSNQHDIFSAMESISSKAYSASQSKRCIKAITLALDIGSNDNPEIRQRNARIHLLKELLANAYIQDGDLDNVLD